MKASSRPTERGEGEPGPIGREIVVHGPVRDMARVDIADGSAHHHHRENLPPGRASQWIPA